MFEKTGEFKYQFGIPGREEGQLWYPRKVSAYMLGSERTHRCLLDEITDFITFFIQQGSQNLLNFKARNYCIANIISLTVLFIYVYRQQSYAIRASLLSVIVEMSAHACRFSQKMVTS